MTARPPAAIPSCTNKKPRIDIRGFFQFVRLRMRAAVTRRRPYDFAMFRNTVCRMPPFR
jgi:hypothetical protein